MSEKGSQMPYDPLPISFCITKSSTESNGDNSVCAWIPQIAFLIFFSTIPQQTFAVVGVSVAEHSNVISIVIVFVLLRSIRTK